MSRLLSDLRHAARLHRRTPAQSITAILVLAVATAFAASFFRLYDNLALKPPAGVDAPREVIGIALSGEDTLQPLLPGRLRSAIAERAATIDAVAGVIYVDDRLSVEGTPVPASNAVVSSEYFEGLGVKMHLGRRLSSDASRAADNVAVLDYGFWERHFGADPGVLGRTLEIGGATFTIIGVAAADFRGMHRGTYADVWFPLEAFARSVWSASPDVLTARFRMFSVARLASGRPVSDAENELRELTETLRGDFRDDLLGLRLVPLEHLAPDPRRHADAVRQVRWLVVASVLLAVAAASNLSLFLLARGARREREIAIRVSIGATRGRLVRQLLAESSVLVLAGIAAGLIVHVWLTELVRALPLLAGVAWRPAPAGSGPVVAFVAVLTLAVLAAVGAVPAVHLSSRSLAQRARARPSGLPASQRVVVGAQVAIATLVLSVAVLFALNLLEASIADPGYESADVSVVQLRRAGDDLPPDAASVLARRRAVEERLLAVDGIDAVGFGGVAPGILSPDTYVVEAVRGPAVEIASQVARVTPGWFQVLRSRWVAGGPPEPEDAEAAVVTRRFAERAWGRLDVVGETIRAPARHSRSGGAADGLSPLRVAGVIDDMSFGVPNGSTSPAVFVNATLPSDFAAFILIRGRASPRDVELALQDVLAGGSPPVEVTGIVSVDEALASLSAPDRVRTAMSGMAAALVALMSALGLFAALRLALESARFELALRSVLGADSKSLRTHALQRGVVIGLPGLLLGLPVSALALGVVRRELELWQIGLLPVLSICALLLALLMSVFIWLPAVRASRIEPSSVLQSE